MKGTLHFSWELYNLRVFMNAQDFSIAKANFKLQNATLVAQN
jgi:hypothetical protein